MYTDAHCHLLKKEEFENAVLVGVKRILLNASRPEEWDEIQSFANENIIACVGVHPWYVDRVTDGWTENLENRLQRMPTLQIGEIGLDKLKPNFALQQKIFVTQLKLAEKYNRLATIHCVRAWGEMMPLLRPFKQKMRLLFHGFSGDKIAVGFLSDCDSYFSVHTASKIPLIPPEKLLLESDAPSGLASPVALPFLYQQLNISAQQIGANFERLLNGR